MLFRSLAALRKEVEPVEPSVFARFLPTWHGITHPRRGIDALVGAIEQLQGVAIPASILEQSVLPARVLDYQPKMLDELCAAGELVWIGAGPLGDDGRVRLLFRDQVRSHHGLRAPAEFEFTAMHNTIVDRLATSGASFWYDLLAACESPPEPKLLQALWDLVWAGYLTNDTFAPVRAPRAHPKRASSSTKRARPQVGRLTRLGPAAGAGRWSLVAPLLEPAPSPTEVAHTTALALIERHGVVTREAVMHEGTPGGFAGVYPVLKALEEAGKVRRGWFVAGLGAAQFAMSGAVERLRTLSGTDDGRAPIVLAAADPAQPYGAALSWPEHLGGRAARNAGAFVVMEDGELVAFVERGGRSMLSYAVPASNDWIAALIDARRVGRVGSLQLQHIDGGSARESVLADRLRTAGFVDGYKGLILR